MTTDHDLESRLRAGLHAAADALPPAPPTGSRTGPPSRRRLPLLIAAGVTVLALGGAGVVALGGGGNGDPDVMVSPPATDPPADGTATDDPSAGEPDGGMLPAGPGTDHPAGTAVASTGDEPVLTVYDGDGQPSSTVALAPLTGIQSVVSDRQGGWIACGLNDDVAAIPDLPDPADGDDAPTTTIPVGPDGASGPDGAADPLADRAAAEREAIGDPDDAAADDPSAPPPPNAFHFRPGHDPQPLDVNVLCTADALGVTDLGGGQVLVYQSSTEQLSILDLTTGEDGAVPVDASGFAISGWSVGGGRLALMGDTGLTLWDLATGEQLPAGPADLPTRPEVATTDVFTADIALSPDGTTLAAMIGEIDETSDVVVVDVDSGEELFRRTVPVSLEGAELSFDGTSVAVGNFYDSYGPVRIFALDGSSERTIDAHGLVP
jgi:hypothetical protein